MDWFQTLKLLELVLSANLELESNNRKNGGEIRYTVPELRIDTWDIRVELVIKYFEISSCKFS